MPRPRVFNDKPSITRILRSSRSGARMPAPYDADTVLVIPLSEIYINIPIRFKKAYLILTDPENVDIEKLENLRFEGDVKAFREVKRIVVYPAGIIVSEESFNELSRKVPRIPNIGHIVYRGGRVELYPTSPKEFPVSKKQWAVKELEKSRRAIAVAEELLKKLGIEFRVAEGSIEITTEWIPLDEEL